jgi:hypothetical protein
MVRSTVVIGKSSTTVTCHSGSDVERRVTVALFRGVEASGWSVSR